MAAQPLSDTSDEYASSGRWASEPREPRPASLRRGRGRGPGRLAISRFGRSYTGEPDQIADELANDAAVRAADTLLLTVPSQLGVDYNAALLETIAREIAPSLGWNPKNLPDPVR